MDLKIKICGMREPENIEMAAQLKPDYLGFIFYPKSKRYMGSMDPTMINNQVLNGITKVGVFVNALIGEVFILANTYKLGLIQLHGQEPAEYCRELKSMRMEVMKAFNIDEDFDFTILDKYMPYCDYFLFDTKVGDMPGGTGKKFNWEVLQNYQLKKPFFLSGGIAPGDEEALKLFEHPMFTGIDINSKFEIEPGLKNVDLLSQFINNINSHNKNKNPKIIDHR